MAYDKEITSYLSSMGINVKIMSQDLLGQGPIEFVQSPTENKSKIGIDRIEITAPYGRYGNNFFQLINAGVIANFLNANNIILPNLSLTSTSHPVEIDNILVSKSDGELSPTVLKGSFFAPFGFESCFCNVNMTWLLNFIRNVRDQIYIDLHTDERKENKRTIAVHFRGDDVFAIDAPVQGWYVQPPASYYIECIHHAISEKGCDFIEIVSLDRKNPAIEIVEKEIEALGIPFRAGSFNLIQDVTRILESEAIIASYGTFCEATALMSSHLDTYYGFRNEASQPFVRPFIQSRIGSVLRASNVRTFVVEDFGGGFLQPGTWANAEWQRDTIAQFPRGKLRLFEAY